MRLTSVDSRRTVRVGSARRSASPAAALVTISILAFCPTVYAQPAGAAQADGQAAEPAAKADAKQPATATPATATQNPARARLNDLFSPSRRQLTIHVRADEDGAPIEGVLLSFNGRVAGKYQSRKIVTDAQGMASFGYPADAKVEQLSMTCKRSGFAAQHYLWRGQARSTELPERVELRLASGMSISGIVQDEEGNAIAGAKVEFHMPVTWPQLQNHVFTATEITTDADGHWKWPDAPSDRAQVNMNVSHPDHLPTSVRLGASRLQSTTLEHGTHVAGRVTNEQGMPIVGAAARLGFDRFGSHEPVTKTDADGRFVLKNCKPGKTLVTVQIDEYAPQFKELTVKDKNDDLSFQLEPGKLLRVRILDREGNAVASGTFCPDTWRSFRSIELRLKTDAEGRIEWRGAPPDVMLCDVFAQGYMSSRRVPITAAGEDEQTIKLSRPLVIHGRVTDAVTGKSLPAFGIEHGQVFNGNDQVYWSRDAAVPYTDGQYSYRFTEPTEGYLLRAVAEGYQPSTTRVFKSDEQDQEFDFQLQPGQGPSGVVLLPDGQPAVGAEVAMASKTKRIFLRLGRFDQHQNQTQVLKADAQGKFQFPASEEKGPFLFMAVHDAGFGQVDGDQFKADSRLTLSPWGKIEGQVLVGNRPDAGREVTYQPRGGNFDFIFNFGYEMKADPAGQFRFDRAMPGQGTVSRVVITDFGRSWQHAPGWNTPVKVAPNETVQVKIGGTGRAVSGQLQLNKDADFELDWTANTPVSIAPWDKQNNQRANNGAWTNYLANIERSGRFQVPDVPAGSYRLTIQVNRPPLQGRGGAGAIVGERSFEFDVPDMPDGRSDIALDLGTLELDVF